MSKIGLFFGSFNPIHNGHLIIAQHMLNSDFFDKIRFIVSAQNPFKSTDTLMEENLRFNLVKKAITNNEYFECSDIEFTLLKPSYTIQTLEYLIEKEPENIFSIIMGTDNLEKLKDWKQIDKIATLVDFHIYKRRGSELIKPLPQITCTVHNAPYLDISATYIRELLKQSKSVRYLIPESVWDILKPQ